MAQAAAQFGQHQHVGEPVECSELKALAGDDVDSTENDQAAGGAEEAADHGVRHVADRAAHPRHAEAAKHDAGGDG